jgi:hypothetical protein
VHVRGRGLVVLTGCGHAGAINIVRHAQRLTAVGDTPRSARWPAPERPRVRAHHRQHRRRADRDESRARCARALHGLACPACPGCSPAQCLGRRQQRLIIPARRGLTATSTGIGFVVVDSSAASPRSAALQVTLLPCRPTTKVRE